MPSQVVPALSLGRGLPTSAPPRGTLYACLLRDVRAAGLLDRRTAYYVAKTAGSFAALVAGWAAFVIIGDSWWQLAVAAYLAVVFTQLGFLGHDAGHQQAFASRRANYILGLICANVGIGLSYAWWVDKHNRHHAHPNQVGSDPDVGAGALAFSADQAARAGRVGRMLYRRQAFLFFPLLLLEALNLHVSSLRALIARVPRHRRWETPLFALHVIGYVVAVFATLPTGLAFAFIAVHQGLFGIYLGCSFAPNHKGMEMPDPAHGLDYLRRQVITSRNVRGGRLTDFMLGGLNYQIEHHLFPSMPRPSLRRSQTMIREFCEQHDLPYTETTLLRSYGLALAHLNEVGRDLRRP